VGRPVESRWGKVHSKRDVAIKIACFSKQGGQIGTDRGRCFAAQKNPKVFVGVGARGDEFIVDIGSIEISRLAKQHERSGSIIYMPRTKKREEGEPLPERGENKNFNIPPDPWCSREP